ncbi:hypothetical protein [Flavobacterium poyangense]|uniref:hypothetical protein n=1 Tax=Flavobacterium poyangense TaxID=2204302 RepID=UPI0014206C62|nr:hypothetical protein [Flavobacterium sp. JXAS1]
MREFVFVSDNKTMDSFLETSKGNFTENIVSDSRTNGFLKDLAKSDGLLSNKDAKSDTVGVIFFPEDPNSHIEVLNNFNETFKVLPDVNVQLITIAYDRINNLPQALMRFNGAILDSKGEVLNKLEKQLDQILKEDPALKSERRQALYDYAVLNESARSSHKSKDRGKCETFTYISDLENMEKFQKRRQGEEFESNNELDDSLKMLAKCDGYVDPLRIDENTLRVVHYPKDLNKRAEVSEEFAAGRAVMPDKYIGILAITQGAEMEHKDLPYLLKVYPVITMDSGTDNDLYSNDRLNNTLEKAVAGFEKPNSLSKEKGAAANFKDFSKSINRRTKAAQASKPKPNVEKKEGAMASIKRFFKR